MDDARRQWEQRTEWPLTGLSVLFLTAYAWPILQPGLRGPVRTVFSAVSWLTWLVFVGDYLVRLRLSRDRRRFVRSGLLDLAMIALPIFRPLRVLRLVMLLELLNRRVTTSLRGKVVVYTVGSTLLIVFCASLAELNAERRAPGSNITSFGDAVWWAVTTISTVGYGDHFPVTVEGRVVAVLLMIGGIALLGVVTASLASWLLEQVREVGEESQSATRTDLRALTLEVQELRAVLAEREGVSPVAVEPAAD